jgi:catechol-2,3-dioxygenase
MTPYSPIWPSRLDHLCLATDDVKSLTSFYATALGMEHFTLADGSVLLQAPDRRLVVVEGEPGARPYHGYRVQDPIQLGNVRDHLRAQGLDLLPSPSSAFDGDAVAVRDPDGWVVVFGLPRRDLPSQRAVNDRSARALPARLQHVVVASKDLGPMMDFYGQALGFVPSDYCLRDVEDPGTRRVAFYRSDPEHHSFAVFGAPAVRADHHAYETRCWNDIRDWADQLSEHHVKIWWGPGRHGPGNNLFFMIQDPEGHQVELSAEIERMPREMAPRDWPLDERSLNLWGPGWMRE